MKSFQKFLVILAALAFILSFSIFCTIELDPETIGGLMGALGEQTAEEPVEPAQQEIAAVEPEPEPEIPAAQICEPGIRPNPGWENVQLENKHRDELIEILGCPANLIRMAAMDPANNKELWVYHPYEQDPTGLYIYLKGDVFYYSKLDEFTGFYCYDMLDPDFWEAY